MFATNQLTGLSFIDMTIWSSQTGVVSRHVWTRKWALRSGPTSLHSVEATDYSSSSTQMGPTTSGVTSSRSQRWVVLMCRCVGCLIYSWAFSCCTATSAARRWLRTKVRDWAGLPWYWPSYPRIFWFHLKVHFSRQLNCWSLRCSWSIVCRRCSNYIIILHLALGFNILYKDNCTPWWET